MISWPHCFGPVARQHSMVGACSRAKLFTHGWETTREEKEETVVPQSPSRAHP
jgi:hypothetical protein